jgi:hypothetical protein
MGNLLGILHLEREDLDGILNVPQWQVGELYINNRLKKLHEKTENKTIRIFLFLKLIYLHSERSRVIY